MLPVSRITTDLPTPIALIPLATPGPFSLIAPSPAASPSILDQFRPGGERLPGLSEALPQPLPITLGPFRDPDETPGAQFIPAIKAWLASPTVMVSVASSVLSYGWAGIIVFTPALMLTTALLVLVLRRVADPRVLLFAAVIIQLYLAGIGLVAIGLKSVILLVIGVIQWTLQSVIFVNILIQAADKILADRESTILQGRIDDLERNLNRPIR